MEFSYTSRFNGSSLRYSLERRDPSPLASKVRKGLCSSAETRVRGVWVPAFAGTTR